MKRLFFCLSALLFLGCMPSEPEISATQLASIPENQTRHYRPVHHAKPDWSISKLGNTLTVYADSRIKLSARRNPNRIVIRENGNIMGHIEQTQTGAQFTPIQDAPQQAIEFHCLKHHEAKLIANNTHDAYQITETGAINNGFELTKQSARYRYTIASRNSEETQTDTCCGNELESPFSPFGTLIFHADTLPMAPRAGLAWYLTYFNLSCE
jgi:hypothetical protein